MSQPVLCAVDVSHGDQDAKVIQKAQEMANLYGTGLDVVTVLPDFGMSVVGTHFSADHHQKAVKDAKSLLNKMVTGAIGADANEKTRHLVLTGTAYLEILKTASKDGAQLIVIGAHKPDFKDYLLGPNAARVVRHSNCSVFVVR